MSVIVYLSSSSQCIVSAQRQQPGCSRLAAPRAHSHPHRAAGVQNRRGVAQVVRAAETESFGDSFKRIAKKIQGSLPIIGLVSRLTAPSGGFDELSYAEFSRSLYDSTTSEFLYALEDFENAHGKIATARWVLLMLWMSKCGPGLVPAKEVINAARRLRITQDMEIEIDRFENAREATLQKYQMLERPMGTLQDQLNLSVDSICTCCIGLKDGEPLREQDTPLMRSILQAVYPTATDAQLQAALDNREQRAIGYA